MKVETVSCCAGMHQSDSHLHCEGDGRIQRSGSPVSRVVEAASASGRTGRILMVDSKPLTGGDHAGYGCRPVGVVRRAIDVIPAATVVALLVIVGEEEFADIATEPAANVALVAATAFRAVVVAAVL